MSDQPINEAPFRLLEDVTLGENVVVYSFTNLYGCSIGDNSQIGTFVEIQRGASVGANCKIQSHTFVCDGVEIQDDVFVGHSVVFINDRRPRASNANGELLDDSEWVLEHTIVERGAAVGSGATILCGVRIGEGALVGAGAVVTKDVAPDAVVAGNPARPLSSHPPKRVRSLSP